MVYNGINTIYNIKLQNAKAVGLPYEVLINTTLNEKFNIEVKDSTGIVDKYPNMNLIVMGVGYGLENNMDMTRYKMVRSKHSPLDAALFNHLPFYLRKIDDVNDYPPSNRHRLRKQIEIQGELYLACYGYELTDIDNKSDILLFNNIDETYVNISKFDTSRPELLNPIPQADTELDSTKENKYVSDFLKIFIYLSETELDSLLKAKEILYGDEPVIITEIGICNSNIKELEDGNIENIQTQIGYFLDTSIDLAKAKEEKSLDFYIDIGGMEVLVI